jgi:multidrug efflux pump subunit AcrA (membrane-fusion protein)
LAQAGGTITSLNVQDSLKVASGEVLAVISNDDYSNQLSMLQKQIDSATLNLQNLQDELAECSPTATVAGTVIFIRIEAGDTVNSGTMAMAIYNTDTMKIVADISETQNDYITEGMPVTITKSGSSGTPLTGTVTKKSLEATASNGVAYFETTITVESKGALSPGIYVTYSITAAQASNVVLAPIAAIQQTPAGTCLFVKSDTAPADAVTLPDGVVPDGYSAVKVETGLTSNDYVEIKSGAAEGVIVFERYIKKNTTSGSDQTSQTSDNGSSSFQGQFPNNGSFQGGAFPGERPGSN